MRPLLLILTLVWGITSHALDKQFTFSSGDLVQVSSPSGTGLFGYQNLSPTPNGSSAVKTFAENTKLRVLESQIIPVGKASLVWVHVVPADADDEASTAGLWVIGGTVPGTVFAYLTKLPGGV